MQQELRLSAVLNHVNVVGGCCGLFTNGQLYSCSRQNPKDNRTKSTGRRCARLASPQDYGLPTHC